LVSSFGNCDAVTVAAGATVGLTLASGTDCSTSAGAGDLDAVTTALIVLASTSAGVAGAAIVVKLKKMIKKIKKALAIPAIAIGKPVIGAVGAVGAIGAISKPLKPLKKIAVLKVLKGGLKAMKALKLLEIKKVLSVGKIVKGLKKGPLALGLTGILKSPLVFGVKLKKMKDFLKDVIGLDKGDLKLKDKLLNILQAGDNDSILEKIVATIKGKLKLDLLLL